MIKTQIFISEPHIVIPEGFYQVSKSSKTDTNAQYVTSIQQEQDRYPLLGQTLCQADLISQQQLNIALSDQKHYTDLKIGEILVLRGWIKQETVNFFAEKWWKLLKSQEDHPIDYYFQEASLLTESQLQRILSEQKHLGLRFGEVAVLNGYIKPKTVDYFITHLPNSLNSINHHFTPKSCISDEEKDIPWIN